MSKGWCSRVEIALETQQQNQFLKIRLCLKDSLKPDY